MVDDLHGRRSPQWVGGSVCWICQGPGRWRGRWRRDWWGTRSTGDQALRTIVTGIRESTRQQAGLLLGGRLGRVGRQPLPVEQCQTSELAFWERSGRGLAGPDFHRTLHPSIIHVGRRKAGERTSCYPALPCKCRLPDGMAPRAIPRFEVALDFMSSGRRPPKIMASSRDPPTRPATPDYRELHAQGGCPPPRIGLHVTYPMQSVRQGSIERLAAQWHARHRAARHNGFPVRRPL